MKTKILYLFLGLLLGAATWLCIKSAICPRPRTNKLVLEFFLSHPVDGGAAEWIETIRVLPAQQRKLVEEELYQCFLQFGFAFADLHFGTTSTNQMFRANLYDIANQIRRQRIEIEPVDQDDANE